VNTSRLLPAYVIPIAAYLATSIAGGYGTGREVVQFFTSQGVYGGLYGLAAATIIIATIGAFSFEFARLFRVYDYQSFMMTLVGPFWIVFEALYILLFLIVLAVVGSAAGSMLSSRTGIDENVGLLVMLVVIGCLIFSGRTVVERAMVFITLLLLSVFFYYFIAVSLVDGNIIVDRLRTQDSIRFSGILPALKFAMYSAPVAVIILFSTKGIKTRREALVSGGLCGVMLMLPGLLFHISFMGKIDDVVNVQVPIFWMIDQLQAPALLPLYLIAMFGTFLGTGLGFLQAVSERLDSWSNAKFSKRLSRSTHAAVAIGGLLISAVLGQFGIIALISKGYGTIAWGFLCVFIVPLLTVGVYKILTFSTSAAEAESSAD